MEIVISAISTPAENAGPSPGESPKTSSEKSLEKYLENYLEGKYLPEISTLRKEVQSLRQELTTAEKPGPSEQLPPIFESSYQTIDKKIGVIYDHIMYQLSQPATEKIVKEIESNLEAYLEPERRTKLNYERSLSALNQLNTSQLSVLGVEINKNLLPKLTSEEKAKKGKECINTSLNHFTQGDLIELSDRIYQKLSLDSYLVIMRDKGLEFWLDKLDLSFGVKSSKKNEGGK
ncbi:hypothetical protein HZC32_02340 [Candidatus Woesearchaeota archaeon]|nr:hypothetical protein [Candidatus Woesearchaeota archaeon]